MATRKRAKDTVQETLGREAPAVVAPDPEPEPPASPPPGEPVSSAPVPSVRIHADPFASVAPSAVPTLVEWRVDGRYTRMLIDATGVDVAWRRWRELHADGDPHGFVAGLERASGERAEALRAVTLVRLERGPPSSHPVLRNAFASSPRHLLTSRPDRRRGGPSSLLLSVLLLILLNTL